MPVLPTDSELAVLHGLWHASLVMALLAIAVALALIIRRDYEHYCGRKRDQRKKELERILWGALNSSVPASADSLPQLDGNDAMLICDLALDILRPLRGEEAARIVHVLETWPIRAHLRRMLFQGRRSERIRMLTLLAHFDDEESLTMLRQWIGAKDFYVQLAALRSLAARHATDVLPEILEHLVRAKRHNTIMLADVLRRFGEPGLDMLSSLAISASQLEVRLAAITALQAIASLLAVPALIKLAGDPLPDIRAYAIAALGHLGDKRADQAILRALSDKEESVRVRAAKAAGKLHLRAAAAALAQLLSDTSWWVRYRAAEALHSMGGIGHSFLRARSKEMDHAGVIATQVLAENEKEAA